MLFPEKLKKNLPANLDALVRVDSKMNVSKSQTDKYRCTTTIYIIHSLHLFCVLFHSQQASQELTEVLNQLWHLDTNRLRPGTDYIISLQVRTTNHAVTSSLQCKTLGHPCNTHNPHLDHWLYKEGDKGSGAEKWGQCLKSAVSSKDQQGAESLVAEKNNNKKMSEGMDPHLHLDRRELVFYVLDLRF